MQQRVMKLLANGLAIAVIAGFIAVIANSLRITLQSGSVFGPTVLTSGSTGKVYTNISTTLYVLGEHGRLEDRIPLAELGLQDTTLTDLLAMPDGRLLIGSSEATGIQACDLVQRRCSAFIQSGAQPVSAFKMAWDVPRQRLLVADGERHRILVYDGNGTLVLASRGGERHLQFPNTLQLTADDTAIVADTNQHRLVWLDAATLATEYREMPVDNALGNFRRVWPTDFAVAPEQRYWVILDNDLLENGDVLVFDADGKPLQRVALPADWDPIKLRARPHDVLLAGFDSVDLVSISPDGKVITPFGDAAFRSELAAMRARREAASRWWHLWIWAAIAPLAVIAGIAAWLDWRRRRLESPPAAAEPACIELPETGKGVYWLEPDPKIVRLWRYSRWLVSGMAVLLFAPAVYILWWLGPEKSVDLVALLIAGGIAFMAILVAGLNALSRGRLGVTRDQVVLGIAGRPHRHYYPRQLVYNSRFISTGDVTVYLRTGKGPIFDPGEIRSCLEPLLANARQLNPVQGYVYLLQQGDRLTWISTLGIACLCGMYLYTEFFMG
ncbi:MAG TPA: hypothetical protein VET88_08620 [Gammaproteobacteria bacterium]|nr:hypothetical protein [Gammaproteobacteria bacterium]